MAEWAFLALGSNVGDRESYLQLGRRHLADLPKSAVVAHSSIEETEPIGNIPQGRFLNQMVLLTTDASAHELLSACQQAERAAGRQRSERWGPRTLDLDIVRLGDQRINDPALRIPHPELPYRGFWIREIAELLPHTWRPGRDPDLPDWACVKPRRREHIVRVAAQLGAWAIAMNKTPDERHRWLRAAFLHDALRDASSEHLNELAGESTGGAGGAASLRHGPAAAAVAEAKGEKDVEVLEAVRYHSVGYKGWGELGRMLYLADFLEPGRPFRQEERAEQAACVPSDPGRVLKEVAKDRLIRAIRNGLQLPAEAIDFWNDLAESR
jgi:2-amino-4-hydroxy-6-hydroxymethyldihydropteridine diphosphokinase